MSGRNRRFLLRSVYVLFVGLCGVGLCSLHLLAQTPAAPDACAISLHERGLFAPSVSSAG